MQQLQEYPQQAHRWKMQTHRRKRLQGQSMIRYLPYLISFRYTSQINIQISLKRVYGIVYSLFNLYPSILFIIKMDLFGNAFSLTTIIQNQSSALTNHILQAFFFTTAISHLLCMLLKLINFAYADTLSHNIFIKVIGIFFFYYLKIWDQYVGAVYMISVFSMALVSIYVYDCCGTITEHFDNWRIRHRDWALLGSYTLMGLSTIYVIYALHSQEKVKYQFSGIYLLIVLLILVGNLIRSRSVIYTLLGILTMNYLLFSRFFINQSSQDQAKIFSNLPLTTIPYFMMALHAQKRQRQTMKSDKFYQLFLSCISFAGYCILNDNSFPLQLALGGVFIFGLIINR